MWGGGGPLSWLADDFDGYDGYGGYGGPGSFYGGGMDYQPPPKPREVTLSRPEALQTAAAQRCAHAAESVLCFCLCHHA